MRTAKLGHLHHSWSHRRSRHPQAATSRALAGALAVLVAVTLVSASPAAAAGRRLIPFQGRVENSVGSAPLDGTFSVVFEIYDDLTAGTKEWDETHSAVSIDQGQINVLLGSYTSLDDYNGDGNTSDRVKFEDGPRYLAITIGGATAALVPRHQLVPSFFAEGANTAEVARSVDINKVTSAAILNGSVQSADLATNAVQTTNILDGAVTASKLGSDVLSAFAPLVMIGRVSLNGLINFDRNASAPVELLSIGATGGAPGQEFTYSELAGPGITKLACQDGVTPQAGTSPCLAARESVGMVFTITRAGKYEVCVEGLHNTFIYLVRDASGYLVSAEVDTEIQLVETAANTAAPVQSGGSHTFERFRSTVNTAPGDTGLQFNDLSPFSFCDVFSFAAPGERAVRVLGKVTVTTPAGFRICDAGHCQSYLRGHVRMAIRELP